MNKLLLLGLIFFCLPFVYADDYDDDNTMLMSEFVLLNYTELSNFDDNYTGAVAFMDGYVYTFDINIYVYYADYYFADEDDIYPTIEHKVVPARVSFNWYCAASLDCASLYPAYVYNFKVWRLYYYYSLINTFM